MDDLFTNGFERIVIPGTGHFPHLEQPKTVADHIVGFLNGCPRQPPRTRRVDRTMTDKERQKAMAVTTPFVEKHRGTEAMLALLDAMDQMPSAILLRARSYELLSPVPGSSVVDVGCGAGRAVAELAERGVHAVGVDPDPWMLAEARKRWPGAEFREAGAEDLPFADGSVRGYRADKVFHALQEPWRAVAEARRVLCPGGRIVLVGQDWDAIMVDSDDAALTRTIVHARADLLGTPRAARQYRNLLLDGGFNDVTVEVHTSVFTDPAMLSLLTGLAESACMSGAVGRDQADEWLAEQHRRAEADRFLIAIPFFVAAATA